MAEKSGSEREFHDLRQQIAHSRDHLGRELEGLRYELNIPLKFRKSFQRHTPMWVAGTALAGLLYAIRPAPRKVKEIRVTGKSGEEKKGEEQKKGLITAGLAMGALRLAGSMLRPVVISYVSRRLGGLDSATKRRM
jgi:hypothetical protein